MFTLSKFKPLSSAQGASATKKYRVSPTVQMQVEGDAGSEDTSALGGHTADTMHPYQKFIFDFDGISNPGSSQAISMWSIKKTQSRWRRATRFGSTRKSSTRRAGTYHTPTLGSPSWITSHAPKSGFATRPCRCVATTKFLGVMLWS